MSGIEYTVGGLCEGWTVLGHFSRLLLAAFERVYDSLIYCGRLTWSVCRLFVMKSHSCYQSMNQLCFIGALKLLFHTSLSHSNNKHLFRTVARLDNGPHCAR